VSGAADSVGDIDSWSHPVGGLTGIETVWDSPRYEVAVTLAVPPAEQFVGLVRKGALDTDDGWQLGLAKFSPHRCAS
jgi:hypothetical protein